MTTAVGGFSDILDVEVFRAALEDSLDAPDSVPMPELDEARDRWSGGGGGGAAAPR